MANRHINLTFLATTAKSQLECEFPPKQEEDFTHIRRKRLTTESGLVCLEDYPYTVSIRYVKITMIIPFVNIFCKNINKK